METLREKVERIINAEHIEGDDLNWWKDVQLRLGGTHQIQREETVDQALEKLRLIGVV